MTLKAEEEKPIAHMRRTYRALRTMLKGLLFAAVACFVGAALIRSFARVSWQEICFRPAMLAAALLCLFASAVAAAVTLRFLVASVAPAPRWRDALAMTWVPRLGKYVPGKAASVVGAVWMLRRSGVALAPATSAVLIKSGVVTLVSLILAVPITLWAPVRQAIPGVWLLTAALVAAGAVCLHPKVFASASNFVLRQLKRPPLAQLPGTRDYVPAVAASVLQWAFAGLGLYLTARSVAPGPLREVGLFISVASLASALGFLALFAPAGLGVQEGVLLAILIPLAGANAAPVIVVLIRLLQVLSDVLLAGAGTLLARPPAAAEPPQENL